MRSRVGEGSLYLPYSAKRGRKSRVEEPEMRMSAKVVGERRSARGLAELIVGTAKRNGDGHACATDQHRPDV